MVVIKMFDIIKTVICLFVSHVQLLNVAENSPGLHSDVGLPVANGLVYCLSLMLLFAVFAVSCCDGPLLPTTHVILTTAQLNAMPMRRHHHPTGSNRHPLHNKKSCHFFTVHDTTNEACIDMCTDTVFGFPDAS